VNTDTDQFSIRIDQKVGPKGQLLVDFQLRQSDGTDNKSRSDAARFELWRAVRGSAAERVITYTRTVSPHFLWSTSVSSRERRLRL